MFFRGIFLQYHCNWWLDIQSNFPKVCWYSTHLIFFYLRVACYSDEFLYKCSSFWDIKFRKHIHIACFSTLYCWIKYENMGRMCICSCILRLDRFIEHKKRKDDTKAKALTQKKRWWSTSFCMLFFFVNASCLPFLLEQQR